uniref:Lysocardiolipin acyltransferase 1 n=1 Tax=Sphaeramia orbicularis TaxID=375764 RepID=A0A673CRD7_9TELE
MAVSVRGLYFVVTLFLGSFFGSIFMLGPVLPLMLLSPAWYRWITDRIVATWLTLPVSLLELVFGVKVVITGDGFIPGERSKICLKAALKAVPGFGWAMQVACFVFIQRRWEMDKKHLENMLDYFCDIREPLQLLLFPEGTDLTENTRAKSDAFAAQNSLPKFEYVLHPRTTGFTFIVDTLRKGDNLDAVHDITVAYPKNIPQTERHLILGLFPREITSTSAPPLCCTGPASYVIVAQQKLFGGMELLELACHQYWKSMAKDMDEKEKVLDGR